LGKLRVLSGKEVMSKIVQDALTEEPSTGVGKGEVRDWLKSLLD
jgi:hypothetical protein